MAKIRMGMVGGGEGAFIGAVHRLAAFLDGQIELVCGAFSSDPERAARSGAALGLPDDRVYPDYQSMMIAEAALPPEQRMQFVSIVTPNHMHFPAAVKALEAGFHVLSDKPATFNLTEALELREAVRKTGQLYGLTHTYNGYPLVKEARERVARGDLGSIRKVVVEYPQGWLADRQEDTDNKQAAWRLDPKRAGISSAWAISAFTLLIWLSTSLAKTSASYAQTSLPLLRVGNWMTTVLYCCASATVLAACSIQARSVSAKKMP